MIQHKFGLYEKALPRDLALSEKLRIAKDLGFDYFELSTDESEEFQEVFGKFDLENYKPSRQVKEQKEKEIAMPKHNHSLWKEDV